MRGTRTISDDDRRRHPRIKLVATCHIYAHHEHFKGTLVDISVGGLCLEADIRIMDREKDSNHFTAGTVLTVDVPKLNLVRLGGHVVRVDPARLGYNIAVQFEKIRSDVAMKLVGKLAKGK